MARKGHALRVGVIGTGYLGLTHAVCMADLGHQVLAIDVDASKIAKAARGEAPFFEPGLEPLLRKNLESGRLRFTGSFADVGEFGDVHFLCVGTPQAAGGNADLSYLHAAVDALTKMCDKIPRNASVVFVDSYANFFTQAVRGVCGLPTGRIDNPNSAKVALVVRGIEQAGRTPVLLASKLSTIQRYPGGDKAEEIMNLHTRQDATNLTSPPTKTGKLAFTEWMALP